MYFIIITTKEKFKNGYENRAISYSLHSNQSKSHPAYKLELERTSDETGLNDQATLLWKIRM